MSGLARLFSFSGHGQTYNGELGLRYYTHHIELHRSKQELLSDFLESLDDSAPEAIQHLVAGEYEKAGEVIAKSYQFTLEEQLHG